MSYWKPHQAPLWLLRPLWAWIQVLFVSFWPFFIFLRKIWRYTFYCSFLSQVHSLYERVMLRWYPSNKIRTAFHGELLSTEGFYLGLVLHRICQMMDRMWHLNPKWDKYLFAPPNVIGNDNKNEWVHLWRVQEAFLTKKIINLKTVDHISSSTSGSAPPVPPVKLTS